MAYRFAAKSDLDRIATKSALSPGLWLVATTLAASVPITIFGPTWAAVLLWTITTVIALGTFGVFVFHSMKNPTLLRSEEYSLRSQALAMYGDGSKSPQEIAGILNSPSISSEDFLGEHGK